MTTTPQKLFDQLQRLQIENASLYERIAMLKQQRSESDAPLDESLQASYAAEIAGYKSQLIVEERETGELKRELARLIKVQEEMQRRIESDNATITGMMLPQLRYEEQQTEQFYNSLLAKCANTPGIDVVALKALVEAVQAKRRTVAEETEANQKVIRLIRFNQAQLKGVEAKPAEPPHKEEKPGHRLSAPAAQSPFTNPIPALAVSSPLPKQRKRVTFGAKDKV
jgi:hypothetical protein